MNRKIYNKKIPFIDLTRFIATFMIVLFHYICAIPLSNNYVLMWGRVGVGLFFMISGAGLINEYYYQLDVRKFYLKRIKSIFIPFWIAYICTWILRWFYNGFAPVFNLDKKYMILSIIGMDGYVANFGVPTFYLLGEWFLGAIIILYLIFPIWRKVFISFPIMTTIFIFCVRFIFIYKNIFPIPVCFNLFTALSYFSLGALGVYESGIKEIQIKKDKMLLCVSACSIVLGWIVGHVYNKQDIGELFCVLGIVFYIYKISLLCVDKKIWKIIIGVCGISYEIFLVHHNIIYNMCPIISNNFTNFSMIIGGIIVYSVILIVAYILKVIVEKVMKTKINLIYSQKSI